MMPRTGQEVENDGDMDGGNPNPTETSLGTNSKQEMMMGCLGGGNRQPSPPPQLHTLISEEEDAKNAQSPNGANHTRDNKRQKQGLININHERLKSKLKPHSTKKADKKLVLDSKGGERASATNTHQGGDYHYMSQSPPPSVLMQDGQNTNIKAVKKQNKNK